MPEKASAAEARFRLGSSSRRSSDIDWVKFYTVGTGLYSFLTVLLHPVTVIKVRQQLLFSSGSDAGQYRSSFTGVRGLYRGVGVVLSLAVPARALYIATLEGSRENIGDALTAAVFQACASPEEAHAFLPLITTVSGGLSGGIAALVAQVFVVPMDVISQKQMVKEGSALSVSRSVLRTEGLRGLYRGFGLSMLSSLPTGSIWWATYGGCQHMLESFCVLRDDEDTFSASYLLRKGTAQLTSGLSAALVAAGLTQPLDTTKTRLQVGIERSKKSTRTSSIALVKELAYSSGFRGFYRGLGPRTVHMGLWGTILSSAYELLRHISRKDHLEQ